MTSEDKQAPRVLTGRVVSNKMQKTVVVVVSDWLVCVP